MSTMLRVLQVVVWVLPTTWLVAYVWTTPVWHRYQEARFLVEQTAAFSLILGLGAAASVFGPHWLDWAGRDPARVGVYLLLAAVFIKQWIIYFRARLRRYRELHGSDNENLRT